MAAGELKCEVNPVRPGFTGPRGAASQTHMMEQDHTSSFWICTTVFFDVPQEYHMVIFMYHGVLFKAEKQRLLKTRNG